MEKKLKSRIKVLVIFMVIVCVSIAFVKLGTKQYTWQKRCNGICAETLGKRMQWIDAANGCAELKAMYTSRPDSWSDREMKRWGQAVTDRAESMNCDFLPKQ